MQAVMSKTFSFEDTLIRNDIPLTRKVTRILQLNIGKKCNQSCIHCHVNAGPERSEIMKREFIDRVLELLSRDADIHTVDITGGAPELNPEFRYLVRELGLLHKRIIDRSNLTVFFEPGQEDTPEYLAEHKVDIIASLPCYFEENVDRQRGNQVFQKSIRALKKLNSLGYGKPDSGLALDLVYNPTDLNLPPNQNLLEADYKIILKKNYNIEFNGLLTITNMPIKRFAQILAHQGKLNSYYNSLIRQFNPQAALYMMCRELLSVGWDGQIYDCDFNQALDIPLKNQALTIWDIGEFSDIKGEISFNQHCYGCTAGDGSSCRGALIKCSQ